jgi:EAL domain-containing protein (putative c-di-GMP-specific phosphodiesterase class I)
MMTRFGCTELQGYYFSRPLEADQMAHFLKMFKAKPIVGEARSAATG